MKITGQKIFVTNIQRTNLVFVKLYTDSGIDGVELIEEACARFPYQPYNVPIFDGTIHLAGMSDGEAVLREKK